MMGLVAVTDIIKENASNIIKQLYLVGKVLILVSFDDKKAAKVIAKKLGIKKVFSLMLSQVNVYKMKILQNEKKRNRVVAMVVGGIYNASVLTQADIGFTTNS
jgi:cation transport ATPase